MYSYKSHKTLIYELSKNIFEPFNKMKHHLNTRRFIVWSSIPFIAFSFTLHFNQIFVFLISLVVGHFKYLRYCRNFRMQNNLTYFKSS